MLCAYYDIHNAGIFDELFGPLYIGKNPTESKNGLLVLKFDLSLIDITSTYNEMVTSFNNVINLVLKEFLTKYRKELGDQVDRMIDTNNASNSLQQVLVSYCYLDYANGHYSDNCLKGLTSVYTSVFGWIKGSTSFCWCR